MTSYDTTIIGAGAAGLMCAIEAGRRGRRVLVVEHADKVGKKILISGGGRCNFTNLFADPEMYISGNPHFPKSALSRYTSADFIALVERHGIAYHEKKLGQLFCDGSASQVVDMLLRECEESGVTIWTSCAVQEVAREGDGFRVETAQGVVESASLVVATGGLSIPKMGATAFAHHLARQFGMAVTETRPGLVPFTFQGEALEDLASLSGLSADTIVTCGGVPWRENILFTHRGLSGPAILQASSYWHQGDEVVIDLLPEMADPTPHLAQQRERHPATELGFVLGAMLPRRLAVALCGPDSAAPIQSFSNKEIGELSHMLKHWTLQPQGTEGYRTAEVTVGGVDTDGLSSQTMEARTVPGLYFIGEAVDVTGPLGGYNFQWAWSSGFAAGQVA
jgi:predicted Rossmann fold flavoprotein